MLTIPPKLWPISCEITCHSVLPAVETAVPDTTEPELPPAVRWHLSEGMRMALKHAERLQSRKPSNPDFSSGRASTHEVPEASAIVALLASPVREHRETVVERDIFLTGNVPREICRLRGRTSASQHISHDVTKDVCAYTDVGSRI